MRIEILKTDLAADFVERIIEFDKLNMKPILESAGIAFPEGKRRKDFESSPTFIVAFDDEAIAGYLEYLRSWRNPSYVYVASVQIAEKHRNTRLLIKLLNEFRFAVSSEKFAGFETNVQKANSLAIRLYRKIGFKLEENPNNAASWLARADRSLLETSPVIPLIEKWRERSRAT